MTPKPPDQNGDGPIFSTPTIAPQARDAPAVPAAQRSHPSTHLSDLVASDSPKIRTSDVPPDRTAASNRYVLTAFHARGGMGEVWRCQDSTIGREVALKRLAAHRGAARERFLCEAQVTGQLEHPGIVPVHDLGFDDNGQPYYVMKMVRGRTLKAAIADFHDPEKRDDSRELQLTRLLKVLLDLCHAVAYAHSRGVIHRDVKPDNVMLGAFGETVVLDWGLAKFTNQPDILGPEQPCSLTPLLSGQSAQTEDGSILGSPLYMPPEMAEGHTADADARTDVYLLGATLYEILTGQPPRHGASRDEILELARTSPPVPPRKLVNQTPRALEAICLKAMSRARGHRYGTALALADDIQRFLAGEPVSAYREPPLARVWRWARRRRQTLARLLLTGLLLVAGLIAYRIYRDAREVKAREQARVEVQQVRKLIDEARFYAASTDAPTELAAYFDPIRGQRLAEQAAGMASKWGPQLARLPLLDQRAPLRQDLDELAHHLAQLRDEGDSADPFLRGERARLATTALFTSPDVRKEALGAAVAHYQAALRQQPAHYWARFQLARCYLALGRRPEAIEAFSGCIALRPLIPWGYVSRALALAVARRFDEADIDLKRALELDPDSIPARLHRGVIRRLKNDTTAAAAEFDALLAHGDYPPEAAFYRGHLFLGAGQAQAALDQADRAVARYPQFKAAYLVRAQANLMLARSSDALADVNKLIADAANPVDIAAQRGRILRHIAAQLPIAHRAPANKLAEQALLEGASRSTASADVFENLGEVLHQQGQLAGAIDAYTRAVKLDPKNPQPLINRAWSHEARGRLADAKADFARALALSPNHAEALVGLGYIEASLGESIPAQRHASLALLHGHNDHLVLHNAACIHAKLAALEPRNTAQHEETGLALVKRAIELWRTTWSGPSELELIQLEVAFTPEFRRKALLQQ